MREINRLSTFRYPILFLLTLHGAAGAAQPSQKTLTAAGGGRIVYGAVDGAPSQAAGLGAMLHSVHSACGEKPKVSQVFRVRGTDSVAVFFNVVNHSGGNRPVAGMVLAARTSSGIEAALLTDAADRFGSSMNPMLKQLFAIWHPGAHPGGQAVPGSGGSAAPLPAFHQVQAGDGSAVVSVPSGWQAKGQQGTMLVSGPHGESIGLNLTKLAASPTIGGGAPRFSHGMIIYPANTNLVSAFPSLFQQFWRLNGASPSRLQLDRVEPVSGLPSQRCVHGTGQVNLVPSERVAFEAVLTTLPPGGTGTYQVMLSTALLPIALADQECGIVGAILSSFQPNQAVIAKEAGQMAAPMIGVIHQIGQAATARYQASTARHDTQNQAWNQDQAAKAAQIRNWEKSQDAQERNTQGFCNYLLDQSVVQDNEANAHGTFDNNTAYALAKANPERYELVDYPNYWKGIDY